VGYRRWHGGGSTPFGCQRSRAANVRTRTRLVRRGADTTRVPAGPVARGHAHIACYPGTAGSDLARPRSTIPSGQFPGSTGPGHFVRRRKGQSRARPGPSPGRDGAGHTSPGKLDDHQAFTELGFDSLTAVDLRNRLERATGLRLAATVVFEQPTPLALTRFLCDELAQHTEPEPVATDTFGELFRQACADDRIDEAMELVRMAARFRSIFHTPDELDQVPNPVPLARGPAEPMLICFPAVVAMSGAHQYAQFAAALRGRRDTVVLPQPGFRTGEQLPSNVAALVEMQSQAVIKHAAGAPYALLGYSSGGWIAHAVAARLEQTDSPPQAAVLIDTYLPTEMNPRLSKCVHQWSVRQAQRARVLRLHVAHRDGRLLHCLRRMAAQPYRCPDAVPPCRGGVARGGRDGAGRFRVGTWMVAVRRDLRSRGRPLHDRGRPRRSRRASGDTWLTAFREPN
jgi:Thioesterase domain/Phosphopantetheine attachment site